MWPFNKKSPMPLKDKYILVTDGKLWAVKDVDSNYFVSTLTGNLFDERTAAAVCWTTKSRAEEFLKRMQV